MKTRMELSGEDIKTAVAEWAARQLHIKSVIKVSLEIDKGYEGNQFDHADPSVKAIVEVEL